MKKSNGPVRNVVRRKETDDSRWTAERDKQLRDLLATGISASMAAERMGISKNAVCGRAARLGLVYGRTERKARETKKVSVLPSKPKRKLKLPIPGVVEGMKDVTRREDEPKPIGGFVTPPDDGACRWVHGDPASATWQHCGHPQQQQSVYCPHHYNRAYNRVAYKGNVVPLKLGVKRR